MQIQLSLSGHKIYYRGLQVAFDQAVHDRSHIVWLTTDRQYAMRYSGDPRHLMRFSVNVNHGFNFGFRTFDTEVKRADVLDRIKTAVNNRANSGSMTKAQYRNVMDQLASLTDKDSGQFKKVWAWYMEDKAIVEVLKVAGYDHVIGREGPSDDVPTIGVFDPHNVKVEPA